VVFKLFNIFLKKTFIYVATAYCSLIDLVLAHENRIFFVDLNGYWLVYNKRLLL